jgi:hypothetical protein
MNALEQVFRDHKVKETNSLPYRIWRKMEETRSTKNSTSHKGYDRVAAI